MPPNENSSHIGFKIINADLYASNADSTAQTITDTGIDITGGQQWTRLRAELIGTSECKFYVNDVLKVTHTTYIPPPTGNIGAGRPSITIVTNKASAYQLNIGRIWIDKEY